MTNTIYLVELEQLAHSLGERRSLLINGMLTCLLSRPEVTAAFVHGSYSRRIADSLSDLDFIVVVDDLCFDSVVTAFSGQIENDPFVALFLQTNRFSWFGTLVGAIFNDGEWFSFETGFVRKSQLNSFFVEPDAWIIKDTANIVEHRKRQCIAEQYSRDEEDQNNLGCELLNLALKFDKSIRRGHLWNALNYCNSARRILFSIRRRGKYGNRQIFVGLPERRIESELGQEELRKHQNTLPAYDLRNICEVFLQLFDAIFLESHLFDERSMKWLSHWRGTHL